MLDRLDAPAPESEQTRALSILGSAALYFCILGVLASMLPLRLEEVLQLTAGNAHSWSELMAWVAFTPGAAPLNYICEWPFVALTHATAVVRGASLLSAAGSLLVFWRIAERMRIRNWAVVVAVFATAPMTVALALLARPGAEGLFLSLTATLLFLQIVERPSVVRVSIYAATLIAAVYTQPLAYAPAIGYLVFFFRFVARPQQRRAIWYLLPATFLPVLAYLPFYAWAAPKGADQWLYANPIPHDAAGQAWEAIASAGIGSAVQLSLLFAGAVIGVWASFLPTYPVRWSDTLLRKNIAAFCVFGGALATLATAFALAMANVASIDLGSVAPAMPLLLLASAIGLEYHRIGPKKWTLLPIAAIVLMLIGIAQDVQLATQRPPNLQKIADTAVPQLAGDSCVVFVSENLSRPLFLTLRPELKARECREFFHDRIVLAVHPYVRPAQLEDAETFFRGLDFVETKRVNIDGGAVIVLVQEGAPATRG